MTDPKPPIAILGLGIMGSAFARNLLDRGLAVRGFDPNEEASNAAKTLGVSIATSASKAAQASHIILTSLPSDKALDETVGALLNGPDNSLDDVVLVELSTLSVECKLTAKERLSHKGITMLDCPVSGTGAQAVERDIVLYASGDKSAYEQCQTTFDAIARDTVFLGDFGNGMRMKFIANLLVAIHNVATAEAMALAKAAGLDLQTVYDVIASGAGTSRIFELRGPMMVADAFEPATMKLDVWQKDMVLIEDFVSHVGGNTPLFDATKPLYDEATDLGLGSMDTAAVLRAIKKLNNSD